MKIQESNLPIYKNLNYEWDNDTLNLLEKVNKFKRPILLKLMSYNMLDCYNESEYENRSDEFIRRDILDCVKTIDKLDRKQYIIDMLSYIKKP